MEDYTLDYDMSYKHNDDLDDDWSYDLDEDYEHNHLDYEQQHIDIMHNDKSRRDMSYVHEHSYTFEIICAYALDHNVII